MCVKRSSGWPYTSTQLGRQISVSIYKVVNSCKYKFITEFVGYQLLHIETDIFILYRYCNIYCTW